MNSKWNSQPVTGRSSKKSVLFGASCETPAADGARTRWPTELQKCMLSSLRFKTFQKSQPHSTRRHPERRKHVELQVGSEKTRHFGFPPFEAPTLVGPHFHFSLFCLIFMFFQFSSFMFSIHLALVFFSSFMFSMLFLIFYICNFPFFLIFRIVFQKCFPFFYLEGADTKLVSSLRRARVQTPPLNWCRSQHAGRTDDRVAQSGFVVPKNTSSELTTEFGFGVRGNNSGEVTSSSGVSLGSGGVHDGIPRAVQEREAGFATETTRLPHHHASMLAIGCLLRNAKGIFALQQLSDTCVFQQEDQVKSRSINKNTLKLIIGSICIFSFQTTLSKQHNALVQPCQLTRLGNVWSLDLQQTSLM